MRQTLSDDLTSSILEKLSAANKQNQKFYPGDSPDRQPIHTVYGGAQLFKSTMVGRLGQSAIAIMEQYAPNFLEFGKVLGLLSNQTGPEEWEMKLKEDMNSVKSSNREIWLAYTIYERVKSKLIQEPVEDFRIDFEDGYGNRPDDEEDATAEFTAKELAKGMTENTISPFIGIRIKPFNEELRSRSIRTLDIFISTLIGETGGKLPNNFVITLPKVTLAAQVTALIDILEILEDKLGLVNNTLKMEIMIETPQSVVNSDGYSSVPSFVKAARGRCVAAHFGVYDYTAASNITAAHQAMDHMVCDFARQVMQASLMGTGIWLSDGATNVLPVGPNRAGEGETLTEDQMKENISVVHDAWKLSMSHIRHSLVNGYYQGWDLHPAQLPIRYATVFGFFLESFDQAALRLKTFIEKAAQATLVGDVFDDAATGQALLNFFLRALNCGAITEEELMQTGLTIDEIRLRSFLKILEGRKS